MSTIQIPPQTGNDKAQYLYPTTFNFEQKKKSHKTRASSPFPKDHFARAASKRSTISRQEQRDRKIVYQIADDTSNVSDAISCLFARFTRPIIALRVRIALEGDGSDWAKTRLAQISTHYQDEYGNLGDLLSEIWQGTKDLYNSGAIKDFLLAMWEKISQFICAVPSFLYKVGSATIDVAKTLANPKFYQTLMVIILFIVLRYIGLTNVAVILVGIFMGLQNNVYLKVAGAMTAILGFTKMKLDFDEFFHGPKSRVQHSGRIQFQMDPDVMHASPASTLASLALLLGSTVFAIKINDYLPADYDAFAKRMNAHSQVARGFSTIHDSFTYIIAGIKETAYSFLGIDPGLADCIPVDLKANAELLMSFDGKVRAQLHCRSDLVRKVVTGYDEYLRLRLEYSRNRSLTTLLDKMQIGWVNLHALAQAHNREPASSRMLPTVLMLRGESSVGKSSLMYHIASYVLAESGKVTNESTDEEITKAIESCVYTRAAETTYWEGYMHQPITMVDDAFQQRDSPANANLDVMELIRMSNPFPMPLNMAELSSKGGTNFDSRVIVYTTNARRLYFESIICNEAVRNRVTFPYEVRIRAPYATDAGKLKDEYKTGKINTKVYSFHDWNTETGAVSTVGITFEHLIGLILQDMRKNARHATVRTEDLVEHTREALTFVSAFENAAPRPEPIFELPPPENEPRPFVRRPAYPHFRGRGGYAFNRNRYQMDDEINLAPLFAEERPALAWESDLGATDMEQYDDFYDWFEEGDEQEPRTGWKAWLPKSLFTPRVMRSATVHAKRAAFYCARDTVPPAYHHYLEFARSHAVNGDINDWQYHDFLSTFKDYMDELARPLEDQASNDICVLEDLRRGIADRWEEFKSRLATSLTILSAITLVAAGYSLFSSLSQPKPLDKWWTKVKVDPSYPEAELIRLDLAECQQDFEREGFVSPPRFRRIISYLEWCRDQNIAVLEGDVDMSSQFMEAKKLFVPDDQLLDTGVSNVEHESGKDRRPSPRRLEEEFESGKHRNFAPRKVLESGKDRKFTSVRRLEEDQDAVHMQGWACDNAKDIALKIRRNVVRLIPYINDRRVEVWINAIMVCDRNLLMNAHYLDRFKTYAAQGNVKIVVCGVNDERGTTYTYCEFMDGIVPYELHGTGEAPPVSTDVVLNILPHISGNRYGSILPYIMKRDNFETLTGRRAVMMNHARTGWEQSFGEVLKVAPVTIDADVNGKTVRAEYINSLHVNISSKTGDCGALYLLDDPRVNRKVVGFHFAGTTGGAYATPLILEDLTQIVSEQAVFAMEVEATENIPEMLRGNCLYRGTTKLGLTTPSKTSLRPTRIFNEIIPTTMKPAQISYSERPTGILAKALSKQFNSQPPIYEGSLNRAVASYSRLLASTTNKRTMRLLTFDEAVAGVPGDEYIRGVERGTSAGWPYCLFAKNGKSEWFGKEGAYTLDSPKSQELKETLLRDIKRINCGGFVRYTFMNVLKDETRPIEKVDAGKTRVFSACPIDFLVLFRMYFMSFLAMMMETRIENESGVGIRAQSMEWTRLARRLNEVGDNVIAGDFSNYDGTLHSKILWKIFEIIDKYYQLDSSYSIKDRQVRRCLWENIVCSESIVNNHIYQLNHSQPSGNPSTAILNSMYNSIACRYVYYEAGHSAFNVHVRMIAYGDDNVLSVSSEVPWNQQSMTDEFAKIGMVYTDEEKTGVVGMRRLEEVSFLKRGFTKPFHGAQFAPLKLQSILECFNWIHNTHDERGVIEQNWAMANLELSFHPADVFDHWTTKIRQVIRKEYGFAPPLIERMRYLAAIREGDRSIFTSHQWV